MSNVLPVCGSRHYGHAEIPPNLTFLFLFLGLKRIQNRLGTLLTLSVIQLRVLLI